VFKSKKVWAWVAELLSAPKVAWQGTLKQKNKKIQVQAHVVVAIGKLFLASKIV
jgi:hypothetical protein